jgi:hypothetical protein
VRQHSDGLSDFFPAPLLGAAGLMVLNGASFLASGSTDRSNQDLLLLRPPGADDGNLLLLLMPAARQLIWRLPAVAGQPR